tara:strand:- start:2126 stop:2749 length:624 start_codon:yes stop_codon:yes gene_type:complete
MIEKKLTENKDFKWFVHLPFLSEEQCDDLIEKIKGEDSWLAGGVYDPQKEKSTSVNPSHHRECDELYLLSKTNKDIKNDYSWLIDKLNTIVKISNDRVWKFDIEGGGSDFRTIQYNTGMHFDWHSGTDAGVLSLNKLTCLIQLSDPKDFDGGDLYLAFTNEDKEFFKCPYKKGYLFIFPSFCNHMVTPLKSGERFIMRQTYLGEPFR